MKIKIAKLRRYLGYGVMSFTLLLGNAVRTSAKDLNTKPQPIVSSQTLDSTSTATPSQPNNAVIEQTQQKVYQNRNVRVCVAENSSQLMIATASGAVVSSESGEGIAALQGNAIYTIDKMTDGLQISSAALPNTVWIDSADGFVQIGDRQYRGRVMIVNDGSQIVAVNVLPIENYLKSVTGSEMYSNWHPEALKAQAVAARSYAAYKIANPASAWFDLYADERDQAYKGVEAETEATIAAVDQTYGEVLVRGTANGTVQPSQILMAQYAATDEISQRFHNGVGMSQYGAQQLARQGSSYLEILGNYYRGTSLTQLA